MVTLRKWPIISLLSCLTSLSHHCVLISITWWQIPQYWHCFKSAFKSKHYIWTFMSCLLVVVKMVNHLNHWIQNSKFEYLIFTSLFYPLSSRQNFLKWSVCNSHTLKLNWNFLIVKVAQILRINNTQRPVF